MRHENDSAHQADLRHGVQAMVAISSVCLVVAVAVLGVALATRPATSNNRVATIAWFSLVPTALLAAMSHAVYIVAAAVDLKKSTIDDYTHFPGLISKSWNPIYVRLITVIAPLSLLFLLVACRLAWYSAIAPLVESRVWRKSIITFKIFDGLWILAMLIFIGIAAFVSSTNSCLGSENGCANSLQTITIMVDFGMGFCSVVLAETVLSIAAGICGRRWLRKSPLAGAIAFIITPLLALQVASYILVMFLSIAARREDNEKVSLKLYCFAMLSICQVAVTIALQQVLHRKPVAAAKARDSLRTFRHVTRPPAVITAVA